MDLTKIDKPFGELDDNTKGALLLAHHRGDVIEGFGEYSSNWEICPIPAWYYSSIYRVQPKPVIGEVVFHGDRLTITFPTRDGLHIPGVYTSPDGLQIKIEVA